uniref:C-type lectin domain-containing protein n=1 Tax=Poecilia formosa TaxID=48698 RepID=A0A087XKR4_POEFO
EAQQYCREKHTDLVTVTNMKDMKRLIKISAGEMKEAWIGLRETHRPDEWNEADRGRRSELHSKCGDVMNCGYLIETPKWGDVSCSTTRYFLCYNETNTTHKYHLIKERKSWQEAQSYCREKHTDLISGTKQIEDEEVKKLMESTSSKPFIGLFRDTWRWSDGSSFSFRHWNKNFNNPETIRGQCAVAVFYGKGRWKNVSCAERKPFICYDDTDASHKYHLIKDKKTWQEAQSYCREKHTDLISGTKQLQDEEVKKLMNSADSKSYTGLFRDNWRWSDGSSFSFRHWNLLFTNEQSISDQCAMTVFNDGGRWKNVSCTERKPFICYDAGRKKTNTTHKYHLIKERKSWQEAQSYCREKHTDLISGTKQIEDEEVKKLMESTSSKPFIGLFRDTWRWSDGSSFSFRHWNKNFNNPETIRGQCAVAVFYGKGRWKNVSCAERKPFICYDGEKKRNRKFHYINENKTWTEAQQYCREKHTDLVTVTNMKDMKRLINISAKDKSEAWIGLTSKPEFTRTWYWSLPGVEFNESETKRKTGEPSDNETENCGYLIKTPKWGDVSCSTTRYFLCYNETNTTHKYHLIKKKKTWQEAQSYCREKHTDLISGKKQIQDEEVKKVMESTSSKSFIGLFRDTWRWSDGSSFSFRHWKKDFKNVEHNRDQCAVTVFDGKGRWKNVNCA